MVFKVGKGGVRSGNTLRGLQSRRTKIYGRHACILGLSNLRPRDLDRFLDKSLDENELVAETLKRTNVLLSLNKKRRWQVPAALNQLISSGSFDKYPMISMLERHKLKRRANCVRFACSAGASGRLRSVSTDKKYFSFTLNNFDEETSKREKRRRYVEALKQQITTPKVKVLRRKHTGRIKSVDVATKEGKTNVTTSEANLGSTKEEYRVEVFYPCPQSCSLTFNPKYTDVVLEEGKSGDLEVKSNIKTPKIRHGRRHRRQRYSPNEIDVYREEIIEEDVNGMWEDSYGLKPEEELDIESGNPLSEHSHQMNYLDMLISQAEKAQKLLVQKKHQVKKARNINQTVNIKKPHIVYIDPEPNTEERLEPTTQAISPPQYLQEIKPLDSVKVVLKSTETSEESLQQKYGAMYMEAHCYPRRFMINVTDDVANLLSSGKSTSKNHMLVSYLIFVHDGVYDDGLDVYRVIFNSQFCNGKHNVFECMAHFSILDIDDIMNNVIGHLLDLKGKNELECLELRYNKNRKGMLHVLYNRMNLKVKTIDPATALSEKPVIGNEPLDNLQKFLSSSFDEDIFCDICYDDVSPTKADAACGTKLEKCGHHCCDSCWASHFQSRMRDGKTTITCPGYDCKNEVGLVMLLSIIDVSVVATLFQRKVEEEVEESENAKWCPNPECGLAIQIDSSNKDLCQDVVCACGAEICFSCFGPAHWPADCDQAEDYFDKLTSIKPPQETVEESEVKPKTEPKERKKNQVYEVEGRVCPRCTRFINKNGGCNFMICKCGREFCWGCMKPYHNTACKIDHVFLFKHTRLVRVHHIERSPLPAVTVPPVIETAKRKATLYQRAMQQRVEASKSSGSRNRPLVLKIVSAANADLQFKEEIIRAMKLQIVPEDANVLATTDVKSSVLHLIKSSNEIKGVLHHVAEFSYVLLQSTRQSVEKQRMQRLADDLGGMCSIFASILDLGDRQDAKTAVQRLIAIQDWAKRALDALIVATNRLRRQ